MVTQSHWKRNYWIDHTRLIIGQFIVTLKSGLYVKEGYSNRYTIRKLEHGFLFAVYSRPINGRIFSRF